MRDYYYFNDEFLDDKVIIDDENSNGMSDKEIKKERRFRKLYKAVKILVLAFLGGTVFRTSYKPSNMKEKNTDYLSRF